MKICVIGGIGSGKSAFLKVAKDLNIYSISADEINSKLLETPSYIEKVKELFPMAVENDVINKKKLAEIIFNSNVERLKLNSIAHPLILNEIVSCKEDPMIVELPLIVESGVEDIFDSIVLIHTPILKRLKRLKSRGLTYFESLKRISAQVPEKELKRLSTKVIDNSGSKEDLESIAKKYLEVLINEEKEN